MTIQLGRIGVTLAQDDWASLRALPPELEDLGYATLWVAGGQLDDLAKIGEVLQATSRCRVGSAIVPVGVHGHDMLAAAYYEHRTTHSDRFVVGIGGAHGPHPAQEMARYLDGLDAAGLPRRTRMLSALGPRMLALARDRTAGALTLLVTPDDTARARASLGSDAALAVHQYVILDTNPRRARDTARPTVRFLTQVPGYAVALRRMGFTDDDIEATSDRLVDGVVAWGDTGTVAAHVREQQEAGADHVSLVVIGGQPAGTDKVAPYRRLADALGLR